MKFKNIILDINKTIKTNIDAYSNLQNINYNEYIKRMSYNLSESQITKFITKQIRKTSKKDIRGEVDIPIFTEEITFLNQNSVERNIYLQSLRNYDVVNLLKLCTHIMISNDLNDNSNSINCNKILSIKEIQDLMIKKYKNSHTKNN